MVRRFQMPQESRIIIRADLPLAVLTQLSLVTAHVHAGDQIPDRIHKLGNRFLEENGPPPAEFNALFGHGFALRDCLALTLPNGHQAMQSWPSFHAFLEQQDTEWFRSLVHCVISNSLDFSGIPIPAEGPDLNNDDELSRYADLFAYEKPGVTAGALVDLISNLETQMKPMLITLLRAYWELAMVERAQALEEELDRALQELCQFPVNGSPSKTFGTLTGRGAPNSELDRLDSCYEVTFLISPGLANELSISYTQGRAVVAFEPTPISPEPEYPVEVFAALGSETRLKIIYTLVQYGEMFGTELVEHLELPQATISNHLATLENAGLVGRRPSGRRVYFSFLPSGLNDAGDFIEQLQFAGVRGGD